MRKLNEFLPDGSAPDEYVVSGWTIEGNDFTLLNASAVGGLLKPREQFSHKGTYGHALIIAGAQQTMGAALLSAMGCLYAGAGLTTLCIPESGLTALNTSLPEVMYLPRDDFFNAADELKKYHALAIGPGLGKDDHAKAVLTNLLRLKRAVIADADALNLLAEHAFLYESIAIDSVISPHMKEFDYIFGLHRNWFDRLETARKRAREKKIIIVLKNQYTFIIDQKGQVYINPTGNPAMAQGGMGDVLTGILAAFIAQGYPAKDAALLSCYVHGMSGDTLANELANVRASQVAKRLPLSIKSLIK